MGNGRVGISNSKYLSILPNIPTQPTHSFSVSLENALLTSGRGFCGKTEARQMGQHTFTALDILSSASPMLSVTFQQLISFRLEYWPVLIVTKKPGRVELIRLGTYQTRD